MWYAARSSGIGRALYGQIGGDWPSVLGIHCDSYYGWYDYRSLRWGYGTIAVYVGLWVFHLWTYRTLSRRTVPYRTPGTGYVVSFPLVLAIFFRFFILSLMQDTMDGRVAIKWVQELKQRVPEHGSA